MKKILLVCMALCFTYAELLYAQTLENLFVSMPDSLSFVMTGVNRADCVDFIQSGMQARVTNRFGRTSVVNQLTDDYMQAQVTSRSAWEMRLLPLEDSMAVICWVTTVEGPIKDSRVRFYDTSWNEQETSRYIPDYPEADDFFVLPDEAHRDSLQELCTKADITFIQAVLSATDATLSFTYNTLEYLTEEERERFGKYIRRTPLVYEWRNGMFVRRME